MLQRSLLYTAVTRGKKLVVLVGTRRAVELAVKQRRCAARATRGSPNGSARAAADQLVRRGPRAGASSGTGQSMCAGTRITRAMRSVLVRRMSSPDHGHAVSCSSRRTCSCPPAAAPDRFAFFADSDVLCGRRASAPTRSGLRLEDTFERTRARSIARPPRRTRRTRYARHDGPVQLRRPSTSASYSVSLRASEDPLALMRRGGRRESSAAVCRRRGAETAPRIPARGRERAPTAAARRRFSAPAPCDRAGSAELVDDADIADHLDRARAHRDEHEQAGPIARAVDVLLDEQIARGLGDVLLAQPRRNQEPISGGTYSTISVDRMPRAEREREHGPARERERSPCR